MIFCIDSNIFIWGIKNKCNPEQEELRLRAEYFIETLGKQNHILIPTVVLAEVLAPEPLNNHPVIMDKISKGFIIADFDTLAAARYAQMFMNKIEELKKIADENAIDNQKMKVDHLIIACALAQNANCIYSHDNGLKAFAQKYIEVRELPYIPKPQPNLFTGTDANPF